jgi:hypothetical protein
LQKYARLEKCRHPALIQLALRRSGTHINNIIQATTNGEEITDEEEHDDAAPTNNKFILSSKIKLNLIAIKVRVILK